MNLALILPSMEHENIVWSYRNAFIIKNESIDGGAGLQEARSFYEWLMKNERNRAEVTVEQNFVPATTYLVFDMDCNKKLIGTIDIRHRLNDYLFKFGGNIGYSVNFEFRNNGYGKAMLKTALLKCKKYDMKRALITCYDDNIASQKIIEYNGGVLENIVEHAGKRTRRYWIELSN